MMWLYFILLFVVSCIGGAIPLFISIQEQSQRYLLAFSGSVLLGISFLHLLPETFQDLGSRAGIFILAGFFLQLFLQKFSHGIEHGHTHVGVHKHDHHTADHDHTNDQGQAAFNAVFAGLAAHAFLEGIPLGYTFHSGQTLPALVIGVAAHKLPEALSLMAFVAVLPFSRLKKFIILVCFAAITPLAGVLAAFYSTQHLATSKIITQLIPVVVGAFTHIATIIFFESETSAHKLNFGKIISICLGIALAALTLLF
jgi:zinc and cadmium transporter